ncbi:MAG: hypothetical protein ACJAR9_000286 [Celeribacter sp.]|jgi:hypothetical protein
MIGGAELALFKTSDWIEGRRAKAAFPFDPLRLTRPQRLQLH